MNQEFTKFDSLFSYSFIALLFLALLFVTAFYFVRLRRLKKKTKKLQTDIQNTQAKSELISSSLELIHKLSYVERVEDAFQEIAEHALNYIGVVSAALYTKENNKYCLKVRLVKDISESYFETFRSALLSKTLEMNPNTSASSHELFTEGGQIISSGVSSCVDVYIYEVRSAKGLDQVIAFGWDEKKSTNDDRKEILSKLLDISLRSMSEIEDKLSREKGKLEAIVQSMSEGVLLVDKNYKILIANQSAEEGLGIKDLKNKGAFVIGETYESLLPFVETVSNVINTGEPTYIKRTAVAQGFFSFAFLPVKYKGQVIGVGVVIHNDSDEERLQNLREDFTAMVVHELRSPLTVIRGSSDMIIKEQQNFTSEQVLAFIQQIKSSSESLLKIVNDLLDSSKIESGKFQVTKALNNLNEALQQEVENYQTLAHTKNIDILVDLDSNTPVFMFDREKIVQVMNNLLSNALKFTNPGEIIHLSNRGFIKLGTRMQGDVVQVFVADSGKGIPNDVKKQLFNKFVQARESAVSNESGTGLGLVISKGIVEAHGGKIWVEDNVPNGSVFVFTLPLTQNA